MLRGDYMLKTKTVKNSPIKKKVVKRNKKYVSGFVKPSLFIF